MEKRLSEYYFVEQEHVTSPKLNNVWSINDEIRRASGPISISAAASGSINATGYDLALAEPMKYIGGAITSGGDTITRARFTIIYSVPTDTPDGYSYARWKNVIFISGGSAWGDEWYARLSETSNMDWSGELDSGTLGGGYTDLSAVTISSFTVIRQLDSLGLI